MRSYPTPPGPPKTTPGSISACAELPCFLAGPAEAGGVYLRVCGVTAPGAVSAVLIKVYLRVCGVTKSNPRRNRSQRGLSPRVRSYPSSGQTSTTWSGSISACAELPETSVPPENPVRVYLRVCGVTDRMKLRVGDEAGLSPRVRSYRVRKERRRPMEGSISACAELPGS